MNIIMSELAITLLGTFKVKLNDEPVNSFRTKSVQALLAYLVCEAKRPSSREQLMDLLWPSMPLKSAQANLRQTVYRLRQTIPEVTGKNGEPVSFLVTNRQTIQINPKADYFADVHKFASLVDGNPEQAIELYRGDFLADFFLPDSETFEEWANNQREVYRRQVLGAMETVTAVSIQNANYDKAIKLTQRQLEIDNLRESSHRQLMEAWARNGRRREALSHYENLRQLFQTELAIEPSQETRTLVDTIRADNFAEKVEMRHRSVVQLSGQRERPRHNLPQRVTSFIGREKEIEALTNLIDENQLVMLTGVGGIGKTNLSLQVARNIQKAFRDGVWLVELAPISDPNLIAQTTASALGLRESAERSIQESVLAYLQKKQCLLILDNCEHLINGVAQFVQMVLQQCADVTILASSREALNVPGERPYPVPALTLPENELSLEEWQQYEAIRLFVERTQIVLPDFQLTTDNAKTLLKICQRLDGIPLAIELAATRMKILTTGQIAERLDDRFRLLTTGSRAALPRQQTLRALIDWSWELLTVEEQRLLRRLSVFAGGMDLEAVETICASEDLPAYVCLDLLNELVNKSLVLAKREQGEETRYYLLETIRQYAQERLTAAEEAETYQGKHLIYFLSFAETAEHALKGKDQSIWLERLAREIDNIRTALDWAQQTNIEAGIRLIFALSWWLIQVQGNIREMDGRLTRLLDQSVVVEPIIKAHTLWMQGMFKFEFTEYNTSMLLLQESLVLYRQLENSLGMVRTLRRLGRMEWHMGQVEQSQQLILESLTLARSLAYKSEIAAGLLALADRKIDYEQALIYLQESESLFREVGDLIGLARTLTTLGQLAMWQGDLELARPNLEESISIQESLDLRETPWILTVLGMLYVHLGDFLSAQTSLENAILICEQTDNLGAKDWAFVFGGYAFLRSGRLTKAKQIFSKSYQNFKKINVYTGIVYSLEGLASLAVQHAQAEKGVRLFAWADAWRRKINDPRPPIEQVDVDRDIALILKMIDEETYATAYADGAAMTLEQISAYALADGD